LNFINNDMARHVQPASHHVAMHARFPLLLATSLLALAACANATSETEETGAAQTGASLDALDPTSLFVDGFRLVTTSRCSGDLLSPGCQVAVLDSAFGNPSGARWASAPFGISTSLSPLDRITIGNCAGQPNDCYTVYAWPATLPRRDYDAIGAQMREYSKLVGTLLRRQAKGPGEESWVAYQRSENFGRVVRAMPRGTTAFCGAVVKSLVETLVPEGSEFRQYGNCGEGGHVGACLAYKAGFDENEIRVCASDNDHFFAMVRHEQPEKKWCILDRWPLINQDNFECDVDWDSSRREVTHKGAAVDKEWFKQVTCVSLQQYLTDRGIR